jgi:hypothetical protein
MVNLRVFRDQPTTRHYRQQLVIAGLDPAIHPFRKILSGKTLSKKDECPDQVRA